MPSIVKIIGAANGTPTPHDGRYVVSWNPHTRYGVLECVSTDDIAKATRFDGAHDALDRYLTISSVQSRRPDGEANRPLRALTIEILGAGAQ